MKKTIYVKDYVNVKKPSATRVKLRKVAKRLEPFVYCVIFALVMCIDFFK